MSYDIIGDIHGYAHTLEALLTKLGYRKVAGVYRHPSRKVIFLGDFIDRGPMQREVVTIAKRMTDANSALSVMGNHEFNAIAYYTWDDSKGDYLRPHSDKNQEQHRAFLEAYDGTADYDDVINWFRKLPMWLELDGVRVVHACWDRTAIDQIQRAYPEAALLGDELLARANTGGTDEFVAIETLLKGKEIPLPDGFSFHDKGGTPRHHIRIRWWDERATNFKAAFMGPASALTHMPDEPIGSDHLIVYSHHEAPVFLGHYWLEGTPKPLAPNIACLDYSIALNGKLVAYRWDGEQTLDSNKFVSVDCIERTEA